MFLPYILHPIRIHGESGTLTDNIFSNQYNKEALSGNLTSINSNYLSRFLFYPSIFPDPPSKLIYMKGTGSNLTKKILYWTILRNIGMGS